MDEDHATRYSRAKDVAIQRTARRSEVPARPITIGAHMPQVGPILLQRFVLWHRPNGQSTRSRRRFLSIRMKGVKRGWRPQSMPARSPSSNGSSHACDRRRRPLLPDRLRCVRHLHPKMHHMRRTLRRNRRRRSAALRARLAQFARERGKRTSELTWARGELRASGGAGRAGDLPRSFGTPLQARRMIARSYLQSNRIGRS
jgi:hypothetical protein